ncbi:MAG TPA: hypothetical protein VEV38_07915, partial [Candidatus Eremiobacteraceae bacterium]|nr:hypothetical protein [Candidatus Eremiobacteraceae bacterium]
MTDSERVTLLKEEYLLLQQFYEDYDGKAITIKGWSATIGLAAIGAGFYETHYLWLFGAGVSFVFWMIESYWKSFQYMYNERIAAIEQAFRDEQFGAIAPLQIYTSWFEVFRRRGFNVARVGTTMIVAFPCWYHACWPAAFTPSGHNPPSSSHPPPCKTSRPTRRKSDVSYQTRSYCGFEATAMMYWPPGVAIIRSGS